MTIINFCENQFNVLSNFSSHQVLIEGILYPTCEHAYHCFRYTDENIKAEILSALSARKAWEISQTYKIRQKDEFEAEKFDIMRQIFLAKLDQHDDVKESLLLSADNLLEKQHDLDYFWGTGSDGSGKNMMGKLWMEIRESLIQ